MVRLFVRHPVTDFPTWKQAYDAFDVIRKTMGVVGHQAYQSIDDPNDVTAWHDFETMDAARAFLTSPQLGEAMANAGVAGEPTAWITQEV